MAKGVPPPLVASKFIPPDLDTRNPGISPLMALHFLEFCMWDFLRKGLI